MNNTNYLLLALLVLGNTLSPMEEGKAPEIDIASPAPTVSTTSSSPEDEYVNMYMAPGFEKAKFSKKLIKRFQGKNLTSEEQEAEARKMTLLVETVTQELSVEQKKTIAPLWEYLGNAWKAKRLPITKTIFTLERFFTGVLLYLYAAAQLKAGAPLVQSMDTAIVTTIFRDDDYNLRFFKLMQVCAYLVDDAATRTDEYKNGSQELLAMLHVTATSTLPKEAKEGALRLCRSAIQKYLQKVSPTEWEYYTVSNEEWARRFARVGLAGGLV